MILVKQDHGIKIFSVSECKLCIIVLFAGNLYVENMGLVCRTKYIRYLMRSRLAVVLPVCCIEENFNEK